jgi:hypothetical protein
VELTLIFVDLLASALTVAFWIDKTYLRGVRPWVLILECVGALRVA